MARATTAGRASPLKVGDRVRVAPTSAMTGHVGCTHEVTALFELEGVLFAVLTPRETPIAPIVAVDELIRERRARRLAMARGR
jgi:hypothetical protein